MTKLIGYDERLVEVDGEYVYNGRSYTFDPIYDGRSGWISTAAFRMCRECNGVISSMGGPGYRSVCLKCYPNLKLADFTAGHTHTVIGEDK